MCKLSKHPLLLPRKLDHALTMLPILIFALMIVLAFTISAHGLAIPEPFDAYVWEVTGAVTIALALISLIGSAFVPMANCRYDCPTGAMLKLFEFQPDEQGWNGLDYLSFSFTSLSLLLFFFT